MQQLQQEQRKLLDSLGEVSNKLGDIEDEELLLAENFANLESVEDVPTSKKSIEVRQFWLESNTFSECLSVDSI